MCAPRDPLWSVGAWNLHYHITRPSQVGAPTVLKEPLAMALILVPIAGGAAAGATLYGWHRLATLCDASARQRLQDRSAWQHCAIQPSAAAAAASPTARHKQQEQQWHAGVFAATFASTWALGARGMRPAFGKLRAPPGVANAAELARAAAPGLTRHGIAATAGVAAGACTSAAYDVRRQQQQQHSWGAGS